MLFSDSLETRLFLFEELADRNRLGYLFKDSVLIEDNAETISKFFCLEYNGFSYLVDLQTASVMFDKPFLKKLKHSEYFRKVKGIVVDVLDYDILFSLDISFYPRVRAGININFKSFGFKDKVWTYYAVSVEDLRRINWEEALGVYVI